MVFGYMRISTQKDTQTTQRQALALKNYAEKNGFQIDKLFEERISGSTQAHDRPAYQDLKKLLRSSDVLLITDIDRLGRNADDVIRELKELKADGIRVVALDMPYMNVWENVNNDGMYNMIIDIMITLKAHMAEQDRDKIVSRINQGLDVARSKGTKLGRPEASLSKDFIKAYEMYLNGKYGKITASQFATLQGIGRSTLYKYIDSYNATRK